MPLDVTRLGRYVAERRDELGLSQLQVAGRGGPSDTTLGKIEAATGAVNRQTLEKLDIGLGWVKGSARRVLEGGEPTIAPPDGPEIREIGEAGRRARNRVVHRSLRDLSFDELWQEWVDLYIASLSLEIEYARRRGIKHLGEARDELTQVLAMAQQGREGRPWVPPWEEISDDEAHDHISQLREAGLDLARPEEPDWSRMAARRGESEGRRLVEEQDRAAEASHGEPPDNL